MKSLSAYYQKIQPWLIIFIAASFFFIIYMQMNIVNAIGPSLMQELGFDIYDLGILSACYYYTNIICILPIGFILDKYSARTILIISFVVTIISILLFALNSSLWPMAFSRLILGTVGASSLLNCIKLGSKWFTPQKQASAIGLATTIGGLGGIMSQLPTAVLISNLGWRNALILCAIFCALFLLLAIIVVKDQAAIQELPQQKNVIEKNDFIKFYEFIKIISRIPANWFASGYFFLMNVPIILLGATWGGIFLHETRKITNLQSANIITALFVGLTISPFIVGWFCDKYKTIRALLIVGAIGCILILLGILFVPNLSILSLAILFCLLGLFTNTQIVIYLYIYKSNPKHLVTTATAFFITLSSCNGLLIPVFSKLIARDWHATFLYDLQQKFHLNNYQIVLSIIVVFYLINLLLAGFLKQK